MLKRWMIAALTACGMATAAHNAGAEPGTILLAQALQGPSCPAPYSVRSPGSNTPTTVRFINNLSYPVELYWIDFNGNWVPYGTVHPNGELTQQTYVGHAWVAWEGNDCVGQSLYFANGDPNQWVQWHF